ncbi:MAG TPA: tRNA lysidine(34) synthetase TilS [Pirellulaceae bacterium]|nr:tRNA lysidine(34) synthetase TilS [Pirellulaceae bacterium]
MRHPLLDAIEAAWPPQEWIDHPVVVACSGGPDSVALAVALRELGDPGGWGAVAAPRNLSLAHVHHGLRADADRDAEAVERLAHTLGVGFDVVRVTLPEGTSEGEGTEGLARRLRYEALRRIARQRGARYLATAHHAEDQAETVLFRMLRGSGESGLLGIERRRRLGPYVTLVRPCLGISRRTLREFAEERGLAFVADPMNADPKYLRSRIRQELLPLLEERFFPDAVAALARLADDAAERRAFVERRAEEYLDRFAVREFDQIAVDFAGATAESPFFVREIVRLLWMRNGWPRQNMSRARWIELGNLVGSHADAEASPPVMFPGGVRVARRDGSVWTFVAPAGSGETDEFCD